MRGIVRRLLVVLVVVVAAAAVWAPFEGGRYLQHEDPLQKADALFVLAGTRFERSLEAVDLYKAGYAPRIVLSPGTPDRADDIVRSRGVPLPREVDIVRDAIVKLGVPSSAVIAPDGSVDNTAQEAALLRSMVEHQGWRTVIVVSSKYHTRRAGFAMRRALAGTGISIIVRASRYDQFDPAHWWRSRAGIRYAISEWQKLIAYRMGLAE